MSPLRGKVAIGLPDVTQNRSAAAEYQAIPQQPRKIADAASPEATKAHYVLAGHYLDRLHGGENRANVTSIVNHKMRLRNNAR